MRVRRTWRTASLLNVVHLAKGALTLHAADQSFVTGPLRRSMAEFTLYMQWLADDDEEAVDVLNRQLQTNQGKLFPRAKLPARRMAKEVNAIVKATIEDPRVPNGKKPPNTEGLFMRHGLDREFAFWTNDSRLAHPTLTAMQYFVLDHGDTIGLRQEPVPAASIEEGIPSLCLWALYSAAYFLNVWLAEAPWTATLTEVAARHGFDPYPVQQRG